MATSASTTDARSDAPPGPFSGGRSAWYWAISAGLRRPGSRPARSRRAPARQDVASRTPGWPAPAPRGDDQQGSPGRTPHVVVESELHGLERHPSPFLPRHANAPSGDLLGRDDRRHAVRVGPRGSPGGTTSDRRAVSVVSMKAPPHVRLHEDLGQRRLVRRLEAQILSATSSRAASEPHQTRPGSPLRRP